MLQLKQFQQKQHNLLLIVFSINLILHLQSFVHLNIWNLQVVIKIYLYWFIYFGGKKLIRICRMIKVILMRKKDSNHLFCENICKKIGGKNFIRICWIGKNDFVEKKMFNKNTKKNRKIFIRICRKSKTISAGKKMFSKNIKKKILARKNFTLDKDLCQLVPIWEELEVFLISKNPYIQLHHKLHLIYLMLI